MQHRRLTRYRLVLAVISTAAEETAIWTVWRWVLPEFGIEWPLVGLIVVMSVWMAFSIWLFTFTTWTLKRQKPAGPPSMVDMRGKAASALNPDGQVKIKGEIWSATATGGSIRAGENIVVVGEDGLRLFVKKAGEVETTR